MIRKKAFGSDGSRAAWDAGADAWEEFVESGADYYRHAVHGPALLDACEPLAGLDVLDLGCGQGFFSRELARRGAKVVGIDLSVELLTFALMHETDEPLGIQYHLIDAARTAVVLGEGQFQLVTACMALQDMADPRSVLRGAFSMVADRGRMVFSIPHPGTDTPFREWEYDEAGNKGALKIDHYFDSGQATYPWRMRRLKYHWETPCWCYTLSEWTEMIDEAGFLIRRLHEPRPTEDQVRQNPHLDDARRLPSFLIFDLVKR